MLIRRQLLGFGFAALLALSGCAATQASKPAAAVAQSSTPTRSAHYVDPGTFVLTRVLPPPPANDSGQTRAELDAMLRIQAERPPPIALRAQEDAKVSVFRFKDAVDSDRFAEANLPLTTALFKKVTEDEGLVIGPVKDAFARPRPFVLEPRLNPLIEKSTSASYPSGHATWGYAVGAVLADMLPERRAEIMERAQEYAFNRVIAGVHYPTDVQAGALAGAAFAAMLFASPQFRKEEAAAAAELRTVLGLPPAAAGPK
jgi:acid phosphatase (class A)